MYLKTLHLQLVIFTTIVFLGLGLHPIYAENVNGVFVQDVKVQPSAIKVGDMFTVAATLVNNSTIPIILEGGTCVPVSPTVPFFSILFDDHVKVKENDMNCAGVGLDKILNSGENLTGTSPDSTLSYVAIESGAANATVTFSYRVTNQTDSAQTPIANNISKSFSFLINDDDTKPQCCGPAYVPSVLDSPLKQFKSGIPAQTVECKSDFQLVLKAEDDSPACVQPTTADTLIERGWAKDVVKVMSNTTQSNLSNFEKIPVMINGMVSDHSFNCTITGGQIEQAKVDLVNKELILSITSTGNGILIADLPRTLIDSKIDGQDSAFIVLEDKTEVLFNQTTTSQSRILSIPFQYGVSQIEITAPVPIQ